jgi:amidase
MDETAFASATRLAAEIRDRRIGCLELLDFFIARAEKFNPALNAVIAWQVDAARDRARAADAAIARGEIWGPLHGVPMTAKESYNVKGLPTTFGNPVYRDNIAASNAVVIDRLLDAGAVIYGKTNVPYLLMDSQSFNEIYGTTNNPWDVTRGPGGSSGGEGVALAAGLGALGAGSDIAGSLRNPAHYCGVYGHKPTWGLVPPRGHSVTNAMTPTDISVVGPMARYAEDLDLALGIMAGPDTLQQTMWKLDLPAPRHRSLREYRVAVWADSPLCDTDASVRERLDAAAAAIAKAGAKVDSDAPRPMPDAEQHRLFMTLLRGATASRLSDQDFAAQKEIIASISPDDMSFRATLARGATLDHRAWGMLNEQRNKLRYAWRDFFQRYDVLLTPVAATAAFPHDHNPDRDARMIRVNNRMVPYGDQRFWAGLASLSYLPATAAPMGLTGEGLPVGLQILSAEGEDRTTIEFARLLAVEIGGFTPPPGY